MSKSGERPKRKARCAIAIIGFDTFNRANRTNWGNASDGQLWAVQRGGGSYAIAGDEGTVTGTTSETVTFLGSQTSAGFDMTVICSRALSQASTTSLICRAQAPNTYYKCRLKQTSGVDNLDLMATVGGIGTVFASVPYTTTPGQYDSIHFQLTGNVLSANAWPLGQDEPDGWMVQYTDAANLITGTGQFGISTTPQPGDTVTYDSFSCDNLLPASQPRADNPYGFTVLAKSPLSVPMLQDIWNSGAAWVRPQTNWGLMEKTDDGSRGSTLSSVINWTDMDSAVLLCNSVGLRVCLTIQNPPSWHCSQVVSPANPRNPIQVPNAADTIAFGTAMVNRYNGVTLNPNSGRPYGTIQALMFNEDFDPFAAGWPANGNATYIGRDSAPVVPVLQGLYPVVKAALPSCLVGGASLLGKRTDTTHIQTWMTRLYATNGGIGGFCDFVDLHFYNCASDPTQPNNNLHDPALPDRLAAIKAVNAQFGYPHMDVWMTETGYQVNNGGTPSPCDVSAQTQSDNLLWTLNVARYYGLSHVFIWTIGSNDNNSLTQGQGKNKSYMPAYNALTTFVTAYPAWPPLPAGQQISVLGLDGSLKVVGLDGSVSVAGLDGRTNAVGVDGKVSVLGLDGSLVVAGGD